MRKRYRLGLLAVFILGVTIGAIGCAEVNKNVGISDPATLTSGISASSAAPAGFRSSNLPQAATTQPTVSTQTTQQTVTSQKLAEEVVDDFKYDLMSLFKAWKANNMDGFRLNLQQGYLGAIVASKAAEATPFILAGDGVDINNINFLQVKVSSLTDSGATVEALFNYSGYKYDSNTNTRKEKIEPVQLHRVYTLKSQAKHWYITTESDVQ